MNGSTTKACFCRDRNSGKPLGKKCPKLTQRAHGVWSIRQELPADEEGNRRLFRRAGYETKEKAQGDLDKVRALLNITDKHDTEGRRRIGDLLVTIMASKEDIPNYEETKRKFATGQSLTQHTTVGKWLELWLAGKKALRKSGKDRYEVDIRCHLLPRIGNIRLDRLTVPHLDAMFEGIAETNVEIIDANLLRRTALDELKRIAWKGQENRARRKAMKETIEAMPPFRRITGPATQQHIKATLRAALNAAIARGIITFNPAAYVELAAAKRPKALVWTDERVEAWLRTGEKPSPVMVWTPEQAGAYLDFMASDRLYGLFHVITFRGLRRGEACGVRDEDYVHLSKSLTIAVQLVQDGWDVVESAPKTDSGERIVTVDEYTDEVLLATRAQREAERAEWGEARQETGRFFTMPDGSWIHPGWLSDYFERTVEAAGLPPIRLHDLRHVAASLMLAAGIDVKIVSETLGHSDSRITRDIYQSVMPKVAAEAAEATAAMVPRGTSRRPAPEPDPEPTEVAVPNAVEELVPTDGQAMGKHGGAKIIAFRPRKVPA